jgi:hypothetical protein
MSVVSEGCNTNRDSLGKCKKFYDEISVIQTDATLTYLQVR